MKLLFVLLILAICPFHWSLAISQEIEIIEVEVAEESQPAEAEKKAEEEVDESEIIIVEEEAPKPQKPDPYPHHVTTMKGTKSFGKLEAEKIKIKTIYGELEVPVKEIVSIIPGLKNHPKYLQHIHQLIDDLSHSNFKKREESQKELSGIGPKIKDLLQDRLKKVTDDEFDAELKTRINNLIEEFDELDMDEVEGSVDDLVQEDRVVTNSFVIVGEVLTKQYKFKIIGGVLSFRLAQINKLVLQKKKESQGLSKVVTIEGTHFHNKNIKNSNIMVRKGDVIRFTASGEITLTPWGNNYKSTPDGNAKAGTLNGTAFKYGMLVCQIRDGEYLLVGSKAKIVAKKSGKIKLGMVMYPNYTNGNYKFPGSYKVKIVVQPK